MSPTMLPPPPNMPRDAQTLLTGYDARVRVDAWARIERSDYIRLLITDTLTKGK